MTRENKNNYTILLGIFRILYSIELRKAHVTRSNTVIPSDSTEYVCMYVYVCKTLFKDTSPVNGALVSTGGVYNVKNYKRY